MKLNLLLMLLFALITRMGISQEDESLFYSFVVEDIEGNSFSFSDLKGKKVMIVNTASKCGFTPQFEELQKLYTQYKDSGFVIVGFPSNDFLKQDPKSNEEIHSFCRRNYGVTFPMMAKIKVKGKAMHEVYKYLTQKELNGYEDSKVKWNFQKYLIDEEGHLVKILSPSVTPLSEEIVSWIKGS